MKRLIFIFVVVFCLSLGIKMPLALFVGDGNFDNIKLYQVSGSILNGKIGRIKLQQGQQLNKLSWRFKPLNLLFFQAAAEVEAEYINGDFKGVVAINPWRKLFIKKARYRNQADEFTQHFASGFVGLAGVVNLEINAVTIDLKTQAIDKLDAFAMWQNAAAVYPVAASLGNIELVATNQENTLSATVKNQGGELQLAGSVNLSAALYYQLDLSLKPRAEISQSLQQVLQQAHKNDLLRQQGDTYLWQTGASLR